MEKFKLKGIAHPGKVDIYKRGTVVLADISDELAQELFNEGCPYLEPVEVVTEESAAASVKPKKKTAEQ